jgi:hypothetical protein
MHTTAFAQDTNEAQPPDATQHIVDAPSGAEHLVRAPHIEADGIDWCAWWAEYAERLD